MHVSTITSKGQSTVPKAIRDFLELVDGQDIYFSLDYKNKIVWLDKLIEGDDIRLNSTMSSKGQITIPLLVREFLRLGAGDKIIYKLNHTKKFVFIEKELSVLECPVCHGAGAINQEKCFLCHEKGSIKLESIADSMQRLMYVSRSYGVGINLVTQEGDGDRFIQKLIPVISLTSRKYPQDILDIAQDFFQMRLIEEFAPKSISDPQKFMYPSDLELGKILDLLKLEESKAEVQKWFRSERTVFNVGIGGGVDE